MTAEVGLQHTGSHKDPLFPWKAHRFAFGRTYPLPFISGYGGLECSSLLTHTLLSPRLAQPLQKAESPVYCLLFSKTTHSPCSVAHTSIYASCILNISSLYVGPDRSLTEWLYLLMTISCSLWFSKPRVFAHTFCYLLLLILD